MKVKNQVKLKAKERKLLKQFINKGSEKARKITRCRILLLAHEGKTDTLIIEALKVARNTISYSSFQICQRRSKSSHQ